jgi:hypothetical protein
MTNEELAELEALEAKARGMPTNQIEHLRLQGIAAHSARNALPRLIAALREARGEIQERGDDASDALALANEAIHQLRAERDAARAEVERLKKIALRIGNESFGAGMDEVNRSRGAKETGDEIARRLIGEVK